MLLQGRLVRINRATFELEPWLAERWESTPDGLTHTFHLRPDLTWSDGAPFTSADVLFSLEAALDPKVKSVIAANLVAGGQPIRATAPDANTVVFTFAGPVGPGVRLLDACRSCRSTSSARRSPPARSRQPGDRPRRRRSSSAWARSCCASTRRASGWCSTATRATGARHADGERLPYLDRIVLEVVPEQNAELLRLQSGDTDLTHSELRPEDYVAGPPRRGGRARSSCSSSASAPTPTRSGSA